MSLLLFFPFIFWRIDKYFYKLNNKLLVHNFFLHIYIKVKLHHEVKKITNYFLININIAYFLINDMQTNDLEVVSLNKK